MSFFKNVITDADADAAMCVFAAEIFIGIHTLTKDPQPTPIYTEWMEVGARRPLDWTNYNGTRPTICGLNSFEWAQGNITPIAVSGLVRPMIDPLCAHGAMNILRKTLKEFRAKIDKETLPQKRRKRASKQASRNPEGRPKRGKYPKGQKL